MLNSIIEVLSLSFMQRALVVGLMVGLVAPTIGIFFVVRRYSSMADTLAHVSLAGVAVSLLAGTAAIPTALVVSIMSVLGIEQLRENKTLPAETIVSLFLFGGLALGVVLLSLAHGHNVNIVNYLFGNILTVTTSDVWNIVILGGVVVVTTLVCWRQFFAISLDEDTARAAGLPVKLLNRVLAILGAATIAIAMNVVGVLLIGALMVIPVLAAMQFKVGFTRTWLMAVIISLVSVALGLGASYALDLASGGSIVLVAILGFILSTFCAKLMTNR